MTSNQQYGMAIVCAVLFISILCAYCCYRDSGKMPLNSRHVETQSGEKISVNELVMFGTRYEGE